MPLKLMYITNQPDVVKIATEAGVDIIFIDMEYIGKDERQGGMDTVKNHHTISDIKNIRKIIDADCKKTEILVRVNPIHNDSETEIKEAIASGADIVMLPMWKTLDEVKKFLQLVGGQAKTCLLLETKEAAEIIDEVLKLDSIDCIYIGLNDLHLSYGMKFMFEPLTEGIVDTLAEKIKSKGIDFGFGGIAKLHEGAVPAEKVLGEHIRLKSDMVILSRSFCKMDGTVEPLEIAEKFRLDVRGLREEETLLHTKTKEFLEENRLAIVNAVNEIIRGSAAK